MDTDTPRTGTKATQTVVCEKLDDTKLPGSGASIYELIRKIRETLDHYAKIPDTEAFEKFLTDEGKESLALDGLIQKYRETYTKLGEQIAEAERWGEEIDLWCEGTVGQEARDKINKLAENYNKKELDVCCTFLAYHNEGRDYLDCRGIRERETAEAKGDFELYKTFESTLKERVASLKLLYDKAKKFFEEEKYNAVYATGLELRRALDNLGVLRTWKWRADQCGTTPSPSSKSIFSPEALLEQLKTALRIYILARYQLFGANQAWYVSEKRKSDNEKDTETYKKACEEATKSRSDDFIKEAGTIASGGTETRGSGQGSSQRSAGGRSQPTAPATTNKY